MNAIDFFKEEDPGNNDDYSKEIDNWLYDKNDMVLFAERYHQAKFKLLGISNVGKSLPIGDVEILLRGLEHIGKWGDEEEERWDDPGDCAMDTLTQYRYSMSIR